MLASTDSVGMFPGRTSVVAHTCVCIIYNER